MTEKSPRQIYINIAVNDLQKSMEFFTKLGFEFNQQFTDDKAACMIVNTDAYFMLLSKQFFSTFTKRAAADPMKQTEAMFAISCDRKSEVDEMVKKAIAAGGTHAMDPNDHGFMYNWSFYDLDGHHWEVMWMDPKGVQ